MLPYFKFGNPTTCTYCGATATETDHVIAVSRQAIYRVYRGNRKSNYGPVTYCCCECNDKLFTKEFDTFLDRCAYISNLYSKQGKAVLWSKKQIQELDYKLRTHVELSREKRLYYRERADWYESRDFILGLSHLSFEPSLNKNDKKFNEELYNYFYSAICFADIYSK